MAFLAGAVAAQVDQLPQTGKTPPKSQVPPRYDPDNPKTDKPDSDNTNQSATDNNDQNMSSSKNTQIDLSPPPDDAKNHPDSGSAIMDSDSDNSDVQEVHPWDPHRAAKSSEVGDFYLKRKNYRAALARYQEALEFKPNDAEATFHIAQCYQNLNDADQAAKFYQEYLKILPQGMEAEEAHKELAKLGKTAVPSSTPQDKVQSK